MNLNLLTPILEHIDSFGLMDMSSQELYMRPKHEQLVIWAAREWLLRSPEEPYTVVIAREEICDARAMARIKVGRKLKQKAQYAGQQQIACPYIVPLNHYDASGRQLRFDESAGAFLFYFDTPEGQFSVIYACSFMAIRPRTSHVAIALVPPQWIEAWADFERKSCAATHHFERSEKVYVVGGEEATFEPKVAWDDVILPEVLKADLRGDMETFFTEGVKLYRQLNLPAFRKLLLVGPPGTGKSSLCAALAKVAIDLKYVVVYVSAAQKNEQGEGSAFDKIQTALWYAKRSDYPVLLVIEEIDVYLKPADKSQILNVLDGFESPNNKHGVLLIATTNYPEMIDERIAKRPGRIDRVIYIPEIQDTDQAARMLRRYMGDHYHDEHTAIADRLVGKTGAFVREASLYARMMALQQGESTVALPILDQSITRLENQLATEKDLVTPTVEETAEAEE